MPLVDRTKGGDLLARIRGIRRKLTQELGFLVQAVHIRDNLELAPNAYRIRLAGVPVGESVVHPDRELAINPGRVFGPLNGIATRDPAFGMEAVWIEPILREHAQSLGYTVVDASHGDRDASVASHPDARARTVRPRRSRAAAQERSPRPRRSSSKS